MQPNARPADRPASNERFALWNRSLENVRILISDSPSGPWQEIG